jgi:hypothetical protein
MTSQISTRARVTIGLAIAGAVVGAIAGAAITVLGKIVAGAPPATLSNYLWNIDAFAAIGAIFGPAITWGSMRYVPLWRTIAEPLVAGIGGAAVGVLLGSPLLFLIAGPVGAGLAILRLNYAHRPKQLT